MRAILRAVLLLAGVTAISGWAQAQTNQMQVTREQPANPALTRPAVPPAPGGKSVAAPTRLQKIFGPNATVGGAIPDIRRAARASSESTPASAGNRRNTGNSNVMINPHTGDAEGIALFAIRF